MLGLSIWSLSIIVFAFAVMVFVVQRLNGKKGYVVLIIGFAVLLYPALFKEQQTAPLILVLLIAVVELFLSLNSIRSVK